ncbi:MAG: nicotinate (nicotinamide) nucleotide adenylyltransferase [Burkholderiaceae bacterium]
MAGVGAQTSRCVGIYGGAFDPPHQAHVALAQAALAQLALDQLYIVPTGDAWHKTRPLSAAPHRLRMAELAFGDLSGAVVDPIELQRQGPSYTLQTLVALQARESADAWWLVLGQDQLERLPTWHGWQDLLSRVHLAVAPRGSGPCQLPDGARPLGFRVLDFVPQPVSATALRDAAINDRLATTSHQLPAAVWQYVQTHHLYQR